MVYHPYKPSTYPNATNTPTPAPPTPKVPKPSAPSPIEMFQKGIKRNRSVYPTLKDELSNDNWHHSFANQARAQDVDEVFDPNYLPTTSEQYELFQEKQKYLCAILESQVETAKGKAIICIHERNYNAQKTYA
jgi:hypothetical protein